MDEPWTPPHNQDQSCAFCGASRPRLVHPLDPAHVIFRLHDKGCTLPTFWATCEPCDRLVVAGDDSALLGLMAHHGNDVEMRAASLAAFRSSDLGSRPLEEGPPDPIRH